MEGGCLGYPGASTVASQPLDGKLPPWLANPRNPPMSPHSRHPSHWWNSGRKRNRDGRGGDAKWTAPQTTAQTLDEELWTAKLVDRLTAKLVNHLTTKLVDRLTAKLVVVNLVKLHLTKFNSYNKVMLLLLLLLLLLTIQKKPLWKYY